MRARVQAWKDAGRPTPSWQSFHAEGAHQGGPTGDWPTGDAKAAAKVETASSAASNLAELPEGKVQHWSKEDLAVFASAGLVLVIALTAFCGAKLGVAEIEASPQEATAIAGPATRLVARHIKVPDAIRGDAADGMALATALSAYVMRVLAVLGARAKEQREQRRAAVYQPNAVNPSASGAAAVSPNGTPYPSANQMPGVQPSA